ncbi:Glycosyltransferase, family 2 [Neorhizobium galegae bv. officinalis]|uniref:Glycosyltransferase, family 2 n=1 Tax=Neorhizobium galegae bv. officinalis TaxID=323656 RepID=A0A0T7FDB6_NEOGA|nr:glycosyltransferase family 2 protein [Neorhizobium galegae]CDZ33004.1 Glycosyltransferase, family 2 [Neorhizobium galegae bv. officinalis]
MRRYFYTLLRRYLSLFVLDQNVVVEIDPTTNAIVGQMPNGRIAFRNPPGAGSPTSSFPVENIIEFSQIRDAEPEYLVITGLIHYERDIQSLFRSVREVCPPDCRLLLTYYSSLWKPLATLASRFGYRTKAPEPNWLAHEDVSNLLTLEGFELIRLDQKVLIPLYVPLISNFVNRYLAPLPILRNFCLLNIALARPVLDVAPSITPSVSIVVPARNEALNIESIVTRIPPMGPEDEIIFIEGNSTDGTWEAIKATQARHPERRILIGQQEGKGKGDAVRKGFAMATRDILMILDADMTVPPEDLPKFFDAIRSGKGEFINGTRLVYPMEKKAMRFFNLLGNKFFAVAFSFVLSQRYKDTLCGTKVISRSNYMKLSFNRSFFGDFDPFGDFDLIFGAARMGLKIIEVPIIYRERQYGETNISRWRHGTILLAMLIFAARKIKFR